MSRVWLVAALSLLAPADRAPSTSSKTVEAVGHEFFEWQKQQSLYLRMRFGLPIERFPDLSLSRVEADSARARGLLDRLATVNEGEVSHDEALSASVLRQQLRPIAEAPRFHWLTSVVTPYASPLGIVNQALADFPIKDAAAEERYLALLGRLPAFIDGLRRHTEAQATRRIRVCKDELPLVRAFLSGNAQPAASSPYVPAAARLAALAPADAERVRRRAGTLVDGKIVPAMKRLIETLSADYEKKAPAGVGLSQYPGGLEYYRWLIRLHTSLDLDAAKIHATGLAEVARANDEMREIQARLGAPGSPSEFRETLEKDPRFIPKTPEEIGDRLMSHVSRIEPKVDAFFVRRPKAPYGVKRLEPALEGAQTFGYYSPPTAAEPRGYYRYNASKLEERSLLGSAGLAYHELVPGHHFQIALAGENTDLPPFRREYFDTAYTEGWAEYAAYLAGDMGMYAEPYDRIGRLAMDLFISTRLVVDTGMNALGWSRERAMTFMKENTMSSETQIKTESLRYSADIPGQALGYKLGALKIRELRERAREKLGERFDIRRFHEAVLSSGVLPLSTLERHIDWFIDQEKSR